MWKHHDIAENWHGGTKTYTSLIQCICYFNSNVSHWRKYNIIEKCFQNKLPTHSICKSNDASTWNHGTQISTQWNEIHACNNCHSKRRFSNNSRNTMSSQAIPIMRARASDRDCASEDLVIKEFRKAKDCSKDSEDFWSAESKFWLNNGHTNHPIQQLRMLCEYCHYMWLLNTQLTQQ